MPDNGWQPCTRPNLWAFQLLSIQNRHAQRGGLQKKKKKKGHPLICSEFGVSHRPRNAIISAIPQVLTFFFFWTPHLWVCRIFDQKVGTSPEKSGRMVTLSIGGINIVYEFNHNCWATIYRLSSSDWCNFRVNNKNILCNLGRLCMPLEIAWRAKCGTCAVGCRPLH